MLAGFAFSYHIISRLAYVIGVGVALRRQEQHQAFTRNLDAEAGYRRFRRLAASLMNNDAVSFFIMCVLTRHTIHFPFPHVFVVIGVILGLAGIAIKRWAAVSLERGSFFWRNFFVPEDYENYNPRGPYRYMRNPMYTIGYIHMYGWALANASLFGLIAAAFDQIAMLTFYYFVEKPHYEQLTGATAGIS